MAIKTIQDAIAEGIVAVYVDPRSGTYYDRSLNTNDASPNNITLDFTGASFADPDGYLLVADDASIKGIPEGCLAVLCDEFTADNQALMYKRNVGATSIQFTWFIASGQFAFADGSNLRTLAATVAGARMHMVNFKTSEIPAHFTDGEPAGAYSGVVTITDEAANLVVGNNNALTGSPFKSKMQAFFILDRNLTDEEASDIFSSLSEDQDFGEARPFQEGDVDLFQTVDDGNITVEDGFTTMTGRLGTAVYLSLWGGNEDDPGGDDTTFTWWGNLDEEDPSLQYRSETQHLLQALPAISINLPKVEASALRDLQWILDVKGASSITAVATIPELNRLGLSVTVEANGVKETFNFTASWEAPQ